MKLYPNDPLFSKPIVEDRLVRPDHCDKTCVRYHTCKFPDSCPILSKDKRDKKHKFERSIIP